MFSDFVVYMYNIVLQNVPRDKRKDEKKKKKKVGTLLGSFKKRIYSPRFFRVELYCMVLFSFSFFFFFTGAFIHS